MPSEMLLLRDGGPPGVTWRGVGGGYHRLKNFPQWLFDGIQPIKRAGGLAKFHPHTPGKQYTPLPALAFLPLHGASCALGKLLLIVLVFPYQGEVVRGGGKLLLILPASRWGGMTWCLPSLYPSHQGKALRWGRKLSHVILTHWVQNKAEGKWGGPSLLTDEGQEQGHWTNT